MVNLSKYIGRDYKKYNCFDLVKEFYVDNFSIDLSHFYEGEIVPDRNTVSTLIVSNKGDFFEVAEPEFGDIVVLKLFGIECHMGIIISKEKFIHSAEKIGSNVDSLHRWKKMIAGYYRHRERHDSA